jgi:hypothetical protein
MEIAIKQLVSYAILVAKDAKTERNQIVNHALMVYSYWLPTACLLVRMVTSMIQQINNVER